MPELSTTIAQGQEWLDQVTGDLMLLDPVDMPAMARFATEVDNQANQWAQADPPAPPMAQAAEQLRQAANHVKDVILEREKDVSRAMAAAGQALDATRIVLRDAERGLLAAPPPPNGSAAPDAAQPPPAASQTAVALEPDEPSPEAEPDPQSAWVDDFIVGAYVEQQQSVVPEMEELVLAFEKSRAPDHIAALRRIIHTVKGESGVVGAMEVERVCHRLEDYLDDAKESVASDVLLAAIDWIGQSATLFGKGRPIQGADSIIAQFGASPPPPAPKAPAKPEAPPAPPPPKPVVPPVESEGAPSSILVNDLDLARDFIAEAQEHFELADEHLLILEKNPSDADAIAAVFRSVHTIKGVAGFLGITPIGSLAHAAETLLDDVRKQRRHFVDQAVELTFAALDMLKLMMNDLRTAVQGDAIMAVRPELATLLGKLRKLLESPPIASAPPPRHKARSASAAPAGEDASRKEVAEDGGETISQAHSVHTSSQTMKVDAVRIDQLLDLIGELVIIESIVSGDPEIRGMHSLRIEKNLAMLGKITRSLRDMGMSMRLVPVDPVFKKMARLVRDLSRKSGKLVELVIKGGDTEIDKGMVEKLGDPLVHMIRNSMDHGLETTAEREALGKPPQGTIVLRAHHVGGNIHIDIEDDGRGLNREAIVQRGIERGIIQSADGMADQDVYSLIFHPGFSTAKQITEISGRGVGMDVVKRNIESLHGSVLIQTSPGKGSCFTLVLPLTTAIIDGMLVRVGRETLIMPTLSILESFRPAPGQVHSVTGRGETVCFRNQLLPLFRLSRLLETPDAETDPRKAIVIVVEEYGKEWALMVDDLLGQQQIVIKSLGEGIGRTVGIVGASILADGRPGLILDVAEVIRLAKGD
jgi:two-component system, chemotaxis family, sensor kinase CheA